VAKSVPKAGREQAISGSRVAISDVRGVLNHSFIRFGRSPAHLFRAFLARAVTCYGVLWRVPGVFAVRLFHFLLRALSVPRVPVEKPP
jgi:hypothetical protein